MATSNSQPTPGSFETLLSGEYPPGTGRPELFTGSRGRGGPMGSHGFGSRGRRGGPPGFGTDAGLFAVRGGLSGEEGEDVEGSHGGLGVDPRVSGGFGGAGHYGFGGFGGPCGYSALGGPGGLGGFGGQGGFGGPRAFGFPPRGSGGFGHFANGGGPFPAAFDYGEGINSALRFGRGSYGPGWPTFPRVDIMASDTQYVLEVEVPGSRKEDINVRVNDDEKSITIEGSFPATIEQASESVYTERRKVPGRKFERIVPLPGFVDKSKAGAKLADGILTVELTKTDKVVGQAVNIE